MYARRHTAPASCRRRQEPEPHRKRDQENQIQRVDVVELLRLLMTSSRQRSVTADGGLASEDRGRLQRDPVRRVGGDAAHDRRRREAPRRRDRLPVGPAHLGPGSPPSPARALRRARWRACGRWSLGRLSSGLPPAGAGARGDVPWQVRGATAGGPRARRAALPGLAAAPDRSGRARRVPGSRHGRAMVVYSKPPFGVGACRRARTPRAAVASLPCRRTCEHLCGPRARQDRPDEASGAQPRPCGRSRGVFWIGPDR